MTVAACYTCRNEADIIEASFRHMLAEGIAHIYTTDNRSDDGTREIMERLAAETGQITIVDDHEPFYRQVHWRTELARMAEADGHEWVVASDVDEFWYSPDGQTVAERLASCSSSKVYARMFLQFDYQTRAEERKPLPKVAYRLGQGGQIHIGNHDVTLPEGEWGVLDLREIQYRSLSHFMRKTRASAATLAPEQRAIGAGSHHTSREAMTDEQMEAEWHQIRYQPTVTDPIPSHLPLLSSFLFTATSVT